MKLALTWRSLRARCFCFLVIGGVGITEASAITFDFVGPMIGAQNQLTFSQAGLVLHVSGADLTNQGPAMVTQWEFGLGVRTDLPNNGNGDGALDSIGVDEQIRFDFTDPSGNPMVVQLDVIQFHGFGDVDDLTLWINGVSVIGPDFHPSSSTWNVAADVSSGALWGHSFAISVSDEGPNWEDDYFRVSSFAVSLPGAQTAEVSEPDTLLLLVLAMFMTSRIRHGLRGGSV